jgi:ArsR family transcriptional regulator
VEKEDGLPIRGAKLRVPKASPIAEDDDLAAFLHALSLPISGANGILLLISIIVELSKFREVKVGDVFKALADPTRREILHSLRKRDMTAGELGEISALAPSTLSSHFRILKEAGLIVAEKQGTSIVYSLNVSAVEETIGAVMALLNVGRDGKRPRA